MQYEAGDGASMLASRYDAFVPGAENEHHRRFHHAIDLVASLTATDNAVLLDTDLRVRGFWRAGNRRRNAPNAPSRT